MIRKSGTYQSEIREKMRGGDGQVTIEHFWKPQDDMKSGNRLFAKLIITPGSSIGFHKHENEDEIFVILKGEGEVDDNGTKSHVKAGDSILTGNGAGHSIRCTGNSNLEVIAVITPY